MLPVVKRFWVDQSGQDLSEYALLLVLIAAALIAVLLSLKDQIQITFQRITSALQQGNTNAS